MRLRKSAGLQVRAFDDFSDASMADRKRILDACLDCVTADAKITIEEAEMIRALAASLECFIPPVVANSMKLGIFNKMMNHH